MSQRTKDRHATLRTTLVQLAEDQIKDAGLGSLKARPLAAQAGCSVGAIYNVFDDLHGLILEVNARTFKAMGHDIAQAIPEAAPLEQLIAMAQAYLKFAERNRNTWAALFSLKHVSDTPRPDWYLGEMNSLFELIKSPLSQLKPDLNADDLEMLTRALFSSIHGIVIMGIDGFSGGVPTDKLEKMIAITLQSLAK